MADKAKQAVSTSLADEQEEVDLRIPSPDRPYYIDLELGFRIYVDRATYNLYMRPREAEAKKEERRSRCIINGKRCMKKCSECPFFRSGYPISIEEQYEKYSLEYEDKSQDIVERLAHQELLEALDKAVADLSEEDRKIVELLKEDASSHEIARRLSIPQRTAYDRIKRILSDLRKKLEPYK